MLPCHHWHLKLHSSAGPVYPATGSLIQSFLSSPPFLPSPCTLFHSYFICIFFGYYRPSVHFLSLTSLHFLHLPHLLPLLSFLLACSWLSVLVHAVYTITELYSCEVNTHSVVLQWALNSQNLTESEGCKWCQCLRRWLILWMSLCWDCQRLGTGCSVKMLWLALSVPRMCFDWLWYKNPVSRVETECRICSKWEILLNIHLDKRRDFTVPSSPHD